LQFLLDAINSAHSEIAGLKKANEDLLAEKQNSSGPGVPGDYQDLKDQVEKNMSDISVLCDRADSSDSKNNEQDERLSQLEADIKAIHEKDES